MICRHTRSQVTDSREEGHNYASMREFRYIKRRRRKCIDCQERFTTYELTVEMMEEAEAQTYMRATGLKEKLSSLANELVEFANRITKEVSPP